MERKIIKKITSGVLLCSLALYTAPVLAFTKDETVYSKFDNNGNIKETIVNSHLKNSDKEKTLNDLTDLLDIVNVGGDENFKTDGNKLIWEANGEDIYYQGKTKKDLPISVDIKYELNGKAVSPKEIIGKSGKVKVTIEYTNNDSHEYYINGRYVTLYTPFVVVCGTIINTNNNKNIEVSTGKVVDNGDKSYVVGVALPGMQESLGISKNKFEIPSKIEIKMESDSFEMNDILMYATPRIIEDKDLNLVDNLDEIFSKLDTLQSSSSQIKNGAEELSSGADELASGAQTFSSKSHEFNSAVNQLSQGTSTINNNYSKLDDGINTINSGATAISNGASDLNSGVKELSSSLATLPENVSQLYNGSSSALTGAQNLSAGIETSINSLNSAISSSLTEALTGTSNSAQGTIQYLQSNNNVLQATLNSLPEGTDESIINSLNAQINANNSAIETYQNIKNTADYKIANIDSISSQFTSPLSPLKEGADSLSNALAQISGGLGQLNNSTPSLSSGLKTLSKGAEDLANGSSNLASGTSTLSSSSSLLKSGIDTLDSNTQVIASANNQLTEGADTISSGASKLSEGAKTLSDGITKFDSEGIQAICNFINGDVKDLSERVKKLKELSDEYNNFTMLDDKDNGSVKFIMLVDSLKNSNSAKKDDMIVEDKKSE